MRNLLAVAVTLLTCQFACASLINYAPPDIVLSISSGSYDSDTNRLYIYGGATNYIDENNTDNIIYGSNSSNRGMWMLDAIVDDTGLTSGYATVYGDLDPDDSQAAGTILSLDLTSVELSAFGGGPKKHFLQFLANVTGGVLQSAFPREVVVTANFANFDHFVYKPSGITGSANIGRPVPEPTSLAGWGLLLLAIIGSRYRDRFIKVRVPA